VAADDLALDFAGNLYYTDVRRVGMIGRVALGGAVSVLTRQPIGKAGAEPDETAGLAFGPQGDLFVGTTRGASTGWGCRRSSSTSPRPPETLLAPKGDSHQGSALPAAAAARRPRHGGSRRTFPERIGEA